MTTLPTPSRLLTKAGHALAKAGRTLLAILFAAHLPLLLANPWEKVRIYTFEEGELPDNFTLVGRGSIDIGEQLAFEGSKALQWQYENQDRLTIGQPIATEDIFHTPQERQMSALSAFWLYNTRPQEDARLRISFLQNDTTVAAFDIVMNFRGWRHFWVPFSALDPIAGGTADAMQLETLCPQDGTLYLDLVAPSSYADRRWPLPDAYGPLQAGGNRHLMPPPTLVEDIIELPAPPTGDAAVLDKIRRRIDAQWGASKAPHSGAVQRLLDNESGKKHIVLSKSYFPYEHTEALVQKLNAENTSFRAAGNLLLQLANTYRNTGDPAAKQSAKEAFLALITQALDSGFRYGHSMGNRIQIGYQTRMFIQACYLMRDPLAENSLLEEVALACLWLSDSSLAPLADGETGLRAMVNMDYFNTAARSHLMAILMLADENLSAALLQHFHHNLNAALTHSTHGTANGFKEDGTTFHHWGHYPAYGMGALSGLASIMRVLADTPYSLSSDAAAALGQALYATSIYANTTALPRGISGRHPYGANINSLKSAFYNFASAGAPDFSLPLTEKIGRAYLRIWGAPRSPNDPLASLIAEENPQGFWSFPYAALAIYRHNDWMASFKGYGKYVWGQEIYGRVNKYGRYQSHGAVEIIPQNGWQGNGVGEFGWDWNRVPGATTHQLPWQALAFDTLIVMAQSEETLVGSVSLDGDSGLFAMQLRETDADDGHGLEAKKSVIATNGTLLFIGSDIHSRSQYPVQTTLYQFELPKTDTPTLWLNSPVAQFPWAASSVEENVLSSPAGSIYYVPNGQPLRSHRQQQQAPYHYHKEAASDSREPTAGDTLYPGNYATAWIDHGITPEAADYLYAVLVLPQSEAEVSAWLEQMRAGTFYQILQQDDHAHTVFITGENTWYYSVFAAGKIKADGPLYAVSAPSFIIIKETNAGDALQIAFNDPDLRMRGGDVFPSEHGGILPGEFQLHPTGHTSPQQQTQLTLKGIWNITTPTAGGSATLQGQNTVLTINAQHGRTYRLTLAK